MNGGAATSDNGPDVWSGRASQEVFVDLSDVGLASMYGPAARRKRFSSICRMWVLHQCSRVGSRRGPGFE